MLLHRLFDALIIVSCATPIKQISHYNKYKNIVICKKNKYNIPSVYADFKKIKKPLISYIKDSNRKLGIAIGSHNEYFDYDKFIIDTYKLINSTNSNDILYSCDTYDDTYKSCSKFIRQDNPPSIILSDRTISGAAIKKSYQDHKLPEPIVISLNKSSIGKHSNLFMIDLNLSKIGSTAFNLIGLDNKEVKITPTLEFIN